MRYQGRGHRALFAVGMDSTTLRLNDTVWASVDDGRSFGAKLLLDRRGGYNTVQVTAAGMIGVVRAPYPCFPPPILRPHGTHNGGTSWCVIHVVCLGSRDI